MHEDTLLTVDDVAERCQVSKQSVYKALRTGVLESQRFGRSVRISEADLECYLTRNSKTGGNEK